MATISQWQGPYGGQTGVLPSGDYIYDYPYGITDVSAAINAYNTGHQVLGYNSDRPKAAPVNYVPNMDIIKQQSGTMTPETLFSGSQQFMGGNLLGEFLAGAGALIGGGMALNSIWGAGAAGGAGAGTTAASAPSGGLTPLPPSGMIGTGGPISPAEAAWGGGTGTAGAGVTGAGGAAGTAGAASVGGTTSGGGLLGSLGGAIGGPVGSAVSSLGSLFGGGSLGSVLPGLAGSVLSGIQGSNVGSAAQQGAAMADPFASERPIYQAELRKLMTDPQYLTQTPMYQAAMSTGLESVNRGLAARGQLGSGARATELMKYGQDLASGLFFPYANLLSSLSMSGSSPAAAAQLYSQGKNNQQGYWGDMVKQGIVGLGGLFGGGSSNQGNSSPTLDTMFTAPSVTYTADQFLGQQDLMFDTWGF